MILDTLPAGESDEERLTRMMQSYGTPVLRLCYLCLRNYSLAEDAAQNVFIKAWESMHSLRDPDRERAWLMKIAVNHCRSVRRSKWFQAHAYSPSLEDLPEPTVAPMERDTTVLQTVLALPEKYRDPLVLYHYENLTVAEIGTALGIPEATAQTRLTRARTLLRDRLEAWYHDRD